MAKALAEFKFHHLGKHFYGTDYDEIQLCKILSFSGVGDYWWNNANGDAQ
jgi:hypothetical protein